MGLNIKNERVHALAREAAREAGTTQTGAIEQALERYLAELREKGDHERGGRRERVLALVREIQESLTDEDRELLRREAVEMYDEYGLPR